MYECFWALFVKKLVSKTQNKNMDPHTGEMVKQMLTVSVLSVKYSAARGRKPAMTCIPDQYLINTYNGSTMATTYCYKLSTIPQRIKGTEMMAPLVLNVVYIHTHTHSLQYTLYLQILFLS